MRDLAEVLRESLPLTATAAARRAAETLRDTYRSGAPPTSLAIADDETAAAYAAYRMPATHAATSAALAAGPADLVGPGAEAGPLRHVDLGGGTGAAVWAVHAHWPGRVTSRVLDASSRALALGAAIAGQSGDPGLADTQWIDATFGTGQEVPPSDLVTAAYLLGELDPDLARSVVADALASTRALLVVEPGTPRGYASVLAVRELVLAAGWRIVAPCPHALACPLMTGDWCHFSVRLQRSTLHRQLKAGERGHEDEKFSFVYAVAPDVAVDSPLPSRAMPVVASAEARVLRHPVQRKGLVQLRVCKPDGAAGDVIISKRHGELYKRARDTDWGDSLPLP